MIGQIIGNYKIEDKLGEGGMGAVYRGVDTMLDREVAIKALRPELASQTAVVERFRSEAVTLAKLNHPNIAALYTMFRQGEELYMVLEFVRGETLDSIIQRRGAMPADEVIPVFCQILDGIDHAHEFGIVHRDIKPANMMLTENGKLKVLDFGIARLLGSARMTRAGNIIGTLEYMAPEQVKGQETDGRSDIYALGMMLYEILTGKLPFDTDNEFELMKSQTEFMPTPPREINPNIPEAVEAAIMQAIQKNPDDRFQTAGDFRETLLDAGFKAQGTMHGATGTFKKAATHPSRPAISGAGVSKSGAEETAAKNEPKATRLGAAETSNTKKEPKATRLGAASAATAGTANTAKATRLGNVGAAQPETAAAASGGSFLSNLKPVHYIGAGVAALVLIGTLIAVPLMMFGGKTNDATDAKTVEKPKVEEAQKPAIVDAPPTAPPTQTQSSASLPPSAPSAPSAPSTISTGGGDLTPVADKPAAPKPADKPSVPKPVEKPAPVAVQKPAAPKPAAPKPAAKKPDAGCILAGDC